VARAWDAVLSTNPPDTKRRQYTSASEGEQQGHTGDRRRDLGRLPARQAD
jgi:hypothetical protein